MKDIFQIVDAVCNIYRCCGHHHGETSQRPHKHIPCCQPSIPHSHSDKFLLLPHDSDHSEKILTYLPNNTACEMLGNRVPTNIGPSNQKIVGRARDTSILVDFVHPDNDNSW
eukprot:441673_1